MQRPYRYFNRLKPFLGLALATQMMLVSSSAASAPIPEYRRATDDPDNVKNKKFTKKERIELALPDVGMIINQSFIQTYLLHAGLTYYTGEDWGYNLEVSYGMNIDKDERKCVETFYNDPKGEVGAECDGEYGSSGIKGKDKTKVNYGPAYMPIREINYIVAGNIVWNPIYGKQLFMLSATSYFDVFITAGVGAVMSTYYPKSTKLRNGRKSRAVRIEDPNDDSKSTLDGGANPEETDQWGKDGRPDAESQTNPFINLGLGQRYHFWKNYSVKFEFRNMTLLGTPNGFENLFAIWGGLGMRF